MSEENISFYEMKEALSSIALEMQRFQVAKEDPPETDEIVVKLSQLHFNIKKKNTTIRQLKHNFKSVIHIVKTVFQAKQNETVLLNNRLMNARSEAALLATTNHSRDETLRHLTLENNLLHSRIDQINKFIEISHAELLKIRNEPHEEISLPMQLKKIIMCCGQYYADYCNEHERRKQLEHSNRFLRNNVNLLRINLAASIAEVKNLRFQLYRIKRKKLLANRDVNKTNQPDCNAKILIKKNSYEPNSLRFDLSTHLDVVNRILNDQSNMISKFREFSDELKKSL